jgi:hypothetical protein
VVSHAAAYPLAGAWGPDMDGAPRCLTILA